MCRRYNMCYYGVLCPLSMLKHIKIKLSSKNNFMTYIPQGFANGIQTLEKNTKLVYFVSNYYNPKLEGGLNLFDPKLKIKLPLKPSVITKKDKNWKFLWKKEY